MCLGLGHQLIGHLQRKCPSQTTCCPKTFTPCLRPLPCPLLHLHHLAGASPCKHSLQGMKGLSFGRPEEKLGWRAQPTCTVNLDSVRVPSANRLGQVRALHATPWCGAASHCYRVCCMPCCAGSARGQTVVQCRVSGAQCLVVWSCLHLYPLQIPVLLHIWHTRVLQAHTAEIESPAARRKGRGSPSPCRPWTAAGSTSRPAGGVQSSDSYCMVPHQA